MKQMVTISRKWNNPVIFTTVTDDEIAMSISLADFILAVRNEISPKPICASIETIVDALESSIGPITWVFTKSEFRQRLTTALVQFMSTQETVFNSSIDVAVSKVLSEVKKESCKVM